MILVIIFLVLAIIIGLVYLFGKNKFSPFYLLLTLWLAAIGIAQLRLSPYENSWTWKFWLVLILFFGLLALTKIFFSRYFDKFKIKKTDWQINEKVVAIVLIIMTISSVLANLYIFWRFGTLPILSSIPDKMRFIINREVFGLWEYLALLPRIFIPLSFIYFLFAQKRGAKILAIINIALGFLILFLYASRVVVIFSVLLCYFSYLIIKIQKINTKKIIIASLVAMITVLAIAIAIPAVRQFITYRDYYSNIDYNPFTYLADLSQLKIPASLNWVIPLYLIPSFNLQALARAVEFWHWPNFYFGGYELSVFNSALRIFHLPQFVVTVPWKELFLPWWVTATFLFGYFVDFGWLGIAFSAVFWGALLAGIYFWATKKPSLLSVMLFAYFSFVVIMSIYTNYLLRPEFYLDLVLIFGLGLLAKKSI